MNARASWRIHLTMVIAILCGTSTLWAFPQKGAAAPSLESLRLLQAPATARADRASLQGKVVVLEFWATWCSPCVASLPHLNELVAKLDPARFQFISIDDEEPAAVQNFLGKKKMSGWVGLDASGAVFRQFGVQSRPTTIILDGAGKMVAATDIESLTAADLQAVAAGKSVAFKPVMEVTEERVAASDAVGTEGGQPLFSVSVSRAAADARMVRANHSPTGTDLLGEDADSLLTDLFNTFSNRYVLRDTLPEGRFDLRVSAADVPGSVIEKAEQQAVLAAVHLQVQPRTVTRSAYTLRATPASAKLLSPSASTHAVKRGSWHGMYLLMNGTMDDLAYVLATGLECPVVNETGITGTFDARLRDAGGSFDSLNATLRQRMGLELVAGGPEMSVTVLEVTKQGK